MRKGTTILAIQVTDEELAAFEADAKAPPFFGNRSKYGHSIIMGRHQMTIVAAPHIQPLLDHQAHELEQLHQHYQHQLRQHQQTTEGQMSQLRATLDQLREELKTSQRDFQERQQALSQCQDEYGQLLEAFAPLQDEHQRLQMQSQLMAFKEEHYQKQVTDLSQQLREAQSQQAKQKADHQRVAAQLQKAQRTIGLVDEQAPRLEALAAQAAQASQAKREPNALEIMMSMLQAPTLSKDTQLGQAFLHAFPGEALARILAVLVYFKEQPQAAKAVLASKGYGAYQASKASVASGSSSGGSAQGPVGG